MQRPLRPPDMHRRHRDCQGFKGQRHYHFRKQLVRTCTTRPGNGRRLRQHRNASCVLAEPSLMNSVGCLHRRLLREGLFSLTSSHRLPTLTSWENCQQISTTCGTLHRSCRHGARCRQKSHPHASALRNCAGALLWRKPLLGRTTKKSFRTCLHPRR